MAAAAEAMEATAVDAMEATPIGTTATEMTMAVDTAMGIETETLRIVASGMETILQAATPTLSCVSWAAL